MKKIVTIFFVAFATTAVVYLACSKDSKSGNPISQNKILKAGKKLDVTVNIPNAAKHIPDDTCVQHGGTVGVGVSWDLATCRSNCEHGIGFRCGRETYVACKDGTHIVISHSNGHCPGDNSRIMTGMFEFYDNGTAKIIFTQPMISEEQGNTTFEMEGDETIDFPDYLLIGGHSYNWIKFLDGNYNIDYHDGDYGSVILSVEYLD